MDKIETLLKSSATAELWEIESSGMVYYEIRHTGHDRVNREYNYFQALKTFYLYGI